MIEKIKLCKWTTFGWTLLLISLPSVSGCVINQGLYNSGPTFTVARIEQSKRDAKRVPVASGGWTDDYVCNWIANPTEIEMNFPNRIAQLRTEARIRNLDIEKCRANSPTVMSRENTLKSSNPQSFSSEKKTQTKLSFSDNQFSRLSDPEICEQAIRPWDHPAGWKDGRQFSDGEYIKEAKRRGFTPERCGLLLGRIQPNSPVNIAQKKPGNSLSSNSLDVQFRASQPSPDYIAVIIGNANYEEGKDIPNVIPAYADAASIKNYVTQALGIKEENIIYLKDAGQSELTATFGSTTNPKGQLYNYVKPGKSKVFVYYSGHGAPGGDDGSSYLVPTDAQASLIDLNGYPLSTLYKNLGQIPAKSVTVVLEACFSGASQSGSVITQASPIYLKAKETTIPPNITVIAAGAANQIASWERDSSSGLFTKYFLKGMSGEADVKPYGNGDGEVGYDELGAYFKDTLTYYARRYYGRDQTVQIVEGGM